MASLITKPTLHFNGRAARHKFSDTADVAVNGAFAADTDWDKSDAALTINAAAPGKADWTGAQAGNADLNPTVPILTVGETYLVKFTLTRAAGTLTTLCGSGTAGTSLNASGNYIEKLVCTGSTALVFRGDAAFIGTLDDVEVFLWVGSTNSAGGITYAGALAWQAANGGLFLPSAIMNNDGSPKWSTLAGVISDNGAGDVRITDAGEFIGVPVGTLCNLDSDGTHTDGIYEITAVDAGGDYIDLDLTFAGAESPADAVYVGGALPNVQAAYDDASTDVVDGAGAYHHRYICTNVDEQTSETITPAGGDRASGKYEHTVGYHSVLYLPSENAADDRVIGDMDVDSYAGAHASNFATSYYAGSIEAGRTEETKVNKRSGDRVSWDSDDNAIDAVTFGADNSQLRNLKIHNTDKTTDGSDGLTAAAAREGTWLVNCTIDDVDDTFGANLGQSIFDDCYLGDNIGEVAPTFSAVAGSSFKGCFISGAGKTFAADAVTDSFFQSCIFYGSVNGVGLAAGTSVFTNCLWIDQSAYSIYLTLATSTAIVTNSIFSPASAADYACYASNDGTFLGGNNIAYSVTADAALTVPFYNNGESAAFWLPNTLEEDPLFVDATNFDFRLQPTSPAWGSGTPGFDPDTSEGDIGLPASGIPTPGGGGVLGQNWSF